MNQYQTLNQLLQMEPDLFFYHHKIKFIETKRGFVTVDFDDDNRILYTNSFHSWVKVDLEIYCKKYQLKLLYIKQIEIPSETSDDMSPWIDSE